MPSFSTLFQLYSRWQIPLFFIGWIGISLATLLPAEQLPSAPGSDKLHHVIGFAAWTIMIAAGNFKTFSYLCVFIWFWGGAIEIIQPYVNRYGEWADFAGDSLGVLLIFIVVFCLRKFQQTKLPNHT
jgi:VanZ family protein